MLRYFFETIGENMKRRTFLKTSTLPILAAIESSFIPTIFANSQIHQRNQFVDVSVLNLTEIREKMVLSDHFDQRNIQIIGFGTSGREITCQLHTDNEYGIHDIHYNQNSVDIEEIVGFELSRFWTIDPFPDIAKADTGVSEYVLNYCMDIDKPDTVIFVGDLESAYGFNSISKGFDLARKKGAFTIAVIKTPSDSDHKVNDEVSIALSKLEKYFDSLLIIPNDFGSHSIDSVMQQAIETIVNWYLTSRSQYHRQFDLTDIKAVLQKGKVGYRVYQIPITENPLEFVKKEIAKDSGIRRLKNGLIHYHGDGSDSLQDMNKVIDLFAEQADMYGYWYFYCTNDADSEKPKGISIISTV
jgi:hypothetical protein